MRATARAEWSRLGLAPPRTDLINGFAYLLTLGFRAASLLPMAAAPAALWVDRRLGPIARVAALRARLVWSSAEPTPRAGRSGPA